MPDHPQCSVTRPSPAFRETFLRQIELQAPHDACRAFGEFLDEMVGESRIATMGPRDRPVSGSHTQHTARAMLLDLEAMRSDVACSAATVGEEDELEDTRLALTVADLLPALDGMISTLRAAVERATKTGPTDGDGDGA